MRFRFLLALCCCCTLFSQAQMDKWEAFIPQMSQGIGGGFQKFNGLNGRIANFPQYKGLPSYTANLDMGWFKEKKRVISSGGFSAGSSMGANHDKESSTIRFLGLHADAGYNLLRGDRVLLYPLVGLGLESYQARFFQDNSGVDFNNLLGSSAVQNNVRPLELKNFFFNYRLGLGVAFRNPAMPHSSIGLQAGYTGSFSSHDWRTNNNQVLMNAPEDKLSRVYVSLTMICQPWYMHHK